MKPVAVLGAGPAGLLAAHAVGLAGHPIVIFSQPTKSVIGGAQFLHERIVGLHEPGAPPDAVIKYRVRGDAATYQQKVYRGVKPAFVSFGNVTDGMTQDAWHLQAIYDRLWDSFGNSINEADLDAEWLANNASDFRAIISAVPAPALCAAGHIFNSVQVKVADICMERVEDNMVVYDGTDRRSWSRSSNLFGHYGTEWGAHVNPPLPDLRTFTKPLATTCDCHPEVLRVGRMGTWTKGVLLNDAFKATVRGLADRGLL